MFERIAHLLALFGTVSLLAPGAKIWFAELGHRWAYVLMLSFALSYAVMPAIIRLAMLLNIVDRPAGRKQHEKITPLLGGLAIFLSFLTSLLLNFIVTPQLLAFLAASSLLLAVCVLDDLFTLPSWIRLLVQVTSSSIVMASGVWIKLFPEHGAAYAPPLLLLFQLLNLGITIFWFVGITNAMNFLDGMDGLAAGLSALISFLVGMLAFQNQQPVLGWQCLALLGACLGFLPYNFRVRSSARIFLGDTGSAFLGFTLAYLAIDGNWSNQDLFVSITSPLLVFSIPIYDMIHITINRIRRGEVRSFKQWIDYAGRDHIHHRFDLLLGGKKRSVLFIIFLGLCFGANALLLRESNAIGTLLLAIQFIGFLSIITILEYSGNRKTELYQKRRELPQAQSSAQETGS